MSPTRPGDLQSRLRGALEPVVTSAGLLLEDVAVSAAGRRKVVRVVVDLPDGPGGVSSDQLTDASREISRLLDDVDLVEGAYTLEVTTPGTDRPLRTPRHYRRAVGRLVTASVAGRGRLSGRVLEAGEDTVVLDVDGRREELAYAELTGARVEVELNRAEQG